MRDHQPTSLQKYILMRIAINQMQPVRKKPIQFIEVELGTIMLC
jgi:hypothetical protein